MNFTKKKIDNTNGFCFVPLNFTKSKLYLPTDYLKELESHLNTFTASKDCKNIFIKYL